ncbi:MAG: carbohydrate kinase family protein [Mycobacteriaceae bacterium]
MIVVCGESLIDLVPSSRTVESTNFVAQLGGGPFNVAVTLGRLGSQVAFVSRVSTDAFGQRIMQQLVDSEVDISLVQRGPEPSSLAVVGLNCEGSAKYTFYIDGTADRLFADSALGSSIEDSIKEIKALSFGTLSLILEPGASAYERLLFWGHAQGVLTILDPNIRPMVIDAYGGADAYQERFKAWLPAVDIVKVSEEDAHWLLHDQKDGDPRQWLDFGVSAVIITSGADGICVLTQGSRVQVPAVSARVVDTVGAGDTVHGALLAWFDQQGDLSAQAIKNYSDEQWEQALKFAVKAASITVSRPGADPPWARELKGD